MTTAKQLKRYFDQAVLERIRPHGFALAGSQQFDRAGIGLTQSYFVGPVGTRGGYRVTGGGLGIRIDGAEEVLRRVRDASYTVGMPMHLVKPERPYEDWLVTSIEDAARVLPRILGDFERYGLPFFERWNSVDAVRDALRSDSPADWFMCTHDSRRAVLVALEYASRGREAAMKLGGRLVEELADQAPKFSVDLRKTLKIVSGLAPEPTALG